MTTYLLLGITLGLTAGILPGPLLTLVVLETIKHSRKEGIFVACTPLITDIPIVLISLFLLTKLSDYSYVFGILSLSGAIFIGYLAFESIRQKGFNINTREIKPQSLKKGIITNLLNPHPYLFWITIGIPAILKGYQSGFKFSLCFIFGFYVCLIGSKIIIAVIISKTKTFLQSKYYILIIRLLGFVLLVFSIFLIKESLVQFKLI